MMRVASPSSRRKALSNTVPAELLENRSLLSGVSVAAYNVSDSAASESPSAEADRPSFEFYWTPEAETSDPKLGWYPLEDAAAYEVAVTVHSWRTVTTTTRHTWQPDDLPFANHEVSVRAVWSDETKGDWTEPRSFLSTTAPKFKGASARRSDVTVSWADYHPSNATEVQIVSASDPDVVIDQWTSAAPDRDRFSATTQLQSGLFKVRIRSNNGSETSDWSAFRDLHVRAQLWFRTPVEDHLQSGKVDFAWRPEFQATHYEIWGNRLGGGGRQIIYDDNVPVTDGVSDISYSAENLPEGNYKVWARAHFAVGEPAQWRLVEFTVGERTGPTLFGPARNSASPTPEFRWEGSKEVQTWELTIRNQRTGAVVSETLANSHSSNTHLQPVLVISGDENTVAASSIIADTYVVPLPELRFFQPTQPLEVDTYTWEVHGVFADGSTTETSSYEFTVIPRPDVVFKENSSFYLGSQITWTPVAKASGYELFIRETDTGRLIHINTTAGDTSVSIPARRTVPGFEPLVRIVSNYDVWVRAFDANNTPLPWSRKISFTAESGTAIFGDVDITPAELGSILEN